MPRLIITLIAIALVGCGEDEASDSGGLEAPNPKKDTTNSAMDLDNLPDGWTAGAIVPQDDTYSDPPASPDPARFQFYGFLEGDSGYRLFSVPADTPVADIVAKFEIGSHGAQSYSYDENSTIEMVAAKATAISEIAPCQVVFADSAGLKLKFSRQIEDSDLDQLAKLFPEDEGFQSGAEGYIIEQEPGRHLFQRVKEENTFHFWWD